MGWKFWRKNEIAAASSVGKIQRLGKPSDLPQEIGRYLVVDQGMDPDWAWSLKCVKKPRENAKSTFDVRIFSSATAAQHGVKVRDYTSLDNHMDLAIFAGWYDKETRNVQLERLIKKAV
ncbi:MAG: hypothetical protein P8012_07440 [Desulfobacterales bacterium]